MGKREEEVKLDFVDVSRAYFHAPAIRKVYVEFPEEDAKEGMVGLLLKSMCGLVFCNLLMAVLPPAAPLSLSKLLLARAS